MKFITVRSIKLFAFCCILQASFTKTILADTPSSALRIGLLTPVTGDFALLGDDNLKGAELALEEEGLHINIQVGDSKTDPKTAVSEFRKLVEVDHIIGAFVMRSPICMTINPISKELKIPIFGGAGIDEFPINNEYAWQFWVPSSEEGAFVAGAMIDRGLKKLAVVTAEDEWTLSLTEGFRKKVENLKSEKESNIVFDKAFLPSENDFRTLIIKLKNTNPDAVFVNLGITQLGPFFKQLRSLNFDKPIYSNFWAQKKNVIDSAGGATENIIFSEMKTDYPKFVLAFENKYKSRPTASVITAYTAFKFIAQTLKANPDINSSADFQKKLLQQKEIILSDINIKVTNRRVLFPMALRIIKNGNTQPLE
jgi:branched-chain amino acid transport system substrate-binding protein